MNLFRKTKETREEPEGSSQEVMPDVNTVETMNDTRRPQPTPGVAPGRPTPASSLPDGPVATIGGSPTLNPNPVTPAHESRPTPPVTPPAPKSVPDTDALRTLVEQAVRDSEGSTLEAVRIGGGSNAPSLMRAGSLNFPALYEKVGLPDPSFSAEQMLTMLEKLPTAMPLEMKRETVNVTLEMLGKKINTTEESIVGDTNRKMTTLASLAQEYDRKTKDRVARGEAEIADLLAQVEAKRQAVAAAKRRFDTIQSVCVKETERLNEIMDFFKATAPALVGQVFGKEEAVKDSGGGTKVAFETKAPVGKPVVESPSASKREPPVTKSPVEENVTPVKTISEDETTPLPLPPVGIGEVNSATPAASGAAKL